MTLHQSPKSWVRRIEEEVDALWVAGKAGYPNSPDASDYNKVAESLGLKSQQICDGDGPGAYYTIYALYDVEYIFGAKPTAIIFEDYAKSVPMTWIVAV